MFGVDVVFYFSLSMKMDLLIANGKPIILAVVLAKRVMMISFSEITPYFI